MKARPAALLLLALIALSLAPAAGAQGEDLASRIRRLLEELESGASARIPAGDAARVYEWLAGCSTGPLRERASATAVSLFSAAGGRWSPSLAAENMSLTALELVRNPLAAREGGCNWTTVYMALLLGLNGQILSNATILVYPGLYTPPIPPDRAARALAGAAANATGASASARAAAAAGLTSMILGEPYAFTLTAALAAADPGPGDLERALGLAPWNETLVYLAGAVEPRLSLELLRRVEPGLGAWSLYALASSAPSGPERAAGASALHALEPLKLTLWERLYRSALPESGGCNMSLGRAWLEPLAGQSWAVHARYCPSMAHPALMQRIVSLASNITRGPPAIVGAIRNASIAVARAPGDPRAWSLLAGATSLLLEQAALDGDAALARNALRLAVAEALANPLAPLSPYWIARAAEAAGTPLPEDLAGAIESGDWSGAAVEALREGGLLPYLAGLASEGYRPSEAPAGVEPTPPEDAIVNALANLSRGGSPDEARRILAGASLVPGGVDPAMLHAAASITGLVAARSGASSSAVAELLRGLPPLPGAGQAPSGGAGGPAPGGAGELPEWARGLIDAYKSTGDPSLLEPLLIDSSTLYPVTSGGAPELPMPGAGQGGGATGTGAPGEPGEEILRAYQSGGIEEALKALQQMSPGERAEALSQLRDISPDLYRSLTDALTGASSLGGGRAPGVRLPTGLEAPHLEAPALAPPGGLGGAPAAGFNPFVLLLAVLGTVLAYAIARSGLLTGIRIGLARRSLEKALRRAQETREPSTVVELYAAMLRLLALLERAKLPSETHREYHETLRGIAREIHGRAMRIYEKAKFAGEPPSPGELGEMMSLAERLAAIASRAARLGRGARV